MPIIHAIVLGLVQGLTEFLPVSSSAHLIVIPWLLGWDDGGLTFDIALHVGTLAAVLIYFFKDWVQIIAHGFGLNAGHDPDLNKNRMLLWLLAVGSIPGAIAGALFEKQAETNLRSPYLIAAMAIGVGLIMWVAEHLGRKQKTLGHVSMTDSIAIGVAQAFAVIPGVSRSGSTIAAGLFCNLERETAARFSFLLSTPIIAGAALKKIWDLHKEHAGIPLDERTAFIAGIVTAAISGAIVIQFFLAYLRRRSLDVFIWYRIIFGIIVFALAAFFRLNGR
ncbi:MAG TPA: undecaprenyl-diphosphatase UppP [Bryobacteraceae bacterium]|nr:undecaprenyl-diphosphatase UppP [Bryobacteraceae bacterium]